MQKKPASNQINSSSQNNINKRNKIEINSDKKFSNTNIDYQNNQDDNNIKEDMQQHQISKNTTFTSKDMQKSPVNKGYFIRNQIYNNMRNKGKLQINYNFYDVNNREDLNPNPN